jgi:hypothetical protein
LEHDVIARVRRRPPWWLVPYGVGFLGWFGLVLAGGVGLDEALRYVAYEVGFVLAPGLATTAVLLPDLRRGILLVAIGAGLGLALELAAFIVTAWLGARLVFDLYPVLVIGGASLLLARRRRVGRAANDEAHDRLDDQPESVGRLVRWHGSVVLVAGLAVGYLALGLFPLTPAVTSTSSPVYYPDLTFNLSLVVELERRMPPSEPQIAGLPLVYHWFSDAHVAAIAQVSGVDPWTLLTRLVPTFWVAIIVIQLAAVGTAISGRRWVGPLAALFVFGLGELDLSLTQTVPFLGTFRSNLWQSPSFLFGLIVFLPSLLVLAPGAPSSIGRPSVGRWILAAALAAACVGTKATVLPVLLGGAVFVAGIGWLRTRSIDRQAFVAIIMAGGAIAIAAQTMYRGVVTGLLIEPLASIVRTPAWPQLAETSLVRGLGPIGAVVLGAAVLTAMLAPLAGLVLLDRRRVAVGHRPWLAGILLAGLAAALVSNQAGLSQIYFLHYAVVAGTILGAWALVDFVRRGVLRIPRWRWHLGLGVGAAVLVIAWTAIEASRLVRAPLAVFLFPYVSLVVAGPFFAAVSAAAAPARRWRIFALVVVSTVLMAASLDAAFDLGPPAKRLASGGTVVRQDGPAEHGLTSELLDGLRWIRDTTPPDAVVAVNNPYRRRGSDPRSFLVSAFGERRVYLEGWGYAAENQIVMARRLEGLPVEEPFADRRSANMAVFERADPNAAAVLRSAGVTYLFVDTWASTPRLDGIAAPVFENSEVRIYRLP